MLRLGSEPELNLAKYCHPWLKAEEEYDAFEDSPPFINPKSVDEDDLDVGYMRVDHTEGIYLN